MLLSSGQSLLLASICWLAIFSNHPKIESRTYFGIQWGGWFFQYNTLPFGWKISPFVYQSTGLVATNVFRSLGFPCLLYIDDRHNGQLQVDLNRGPYSQLQTMDERNLAAANSAIFLVCYFLIQLGYFLGLSKSILCPAQVFPYLGFLSDSTRLAFRLIPAKKEKFLILVQQVLGCSTVSVKTLQRLVGKCLVFPGRSGSTFVHQGDELSHFQRHAY